MLRLDLNSLKTAVGSPLVTTMSYWDDEGTWRTRTSPKETRSRTKWRSISLPEVAAASCWRRTLGQEEAGGDLR